MATVSIINKEMIVKSIQETEEFAKDLAGKLKLPAVLALSGELGAGKTTFTKFLAKSLGIKENIISPTFTIINSYKIQNTKYKLIHIDCYRLLNPEKLLDLGFNDILQDKNSIVVIEWAECVKNFLPKNTLWIEFKHNGNNQRKISLITNNELL